MPREPLIDGHGRRIADVRVSVTDRCNFRCQYCMPAEGLPWLEREAVLSFEEIVRLTTLLAEMGVHDVRLTGGEPLVRRDFPKLAGMLAEVPGVEDLSVTTNGYLLERDAEALVRAGHQPLQRLDRLAAARPLLRDDPPRRASARAPRPRGARAVPRGAPDQGQRRRDARLHRGRGAPVRASSPARTPTRCASSSSCRSTPTTTGRRTAFCQRRRDPGGDQRRPPARGRAARGPRDRAGLPVRRRQRPDRLHQPGQRAVLRRLQPHPPHRRRQAADLPVLAQRDRPARAAARRARATTTSSRSSATRCGARSSSTASTTRASCSRRAR